MPVVPGANFNAGSSFVDVIMRNQAMAQQAQADRERIALQRQQMASEGRRAQEDLAFRREALVKEQLAREQQIAMQRERFGVEDRRWQAGEERATRREGVEQKRWDESQAYEKFKDAQAETRFKAEQAWREGKDKEDTRRWDRTEEFNKQQADERKAEVAAKQKWDKEQAILASEHERIRTGMQENARKEDVDFRERKFKADELNAAAQRTLENAKLANMKQGDLMQLSMQITKMMSEAQAGGLDPNQVLKNLNDINAQLGINMTPAQPGQAVKPKASAQDVLGALNPTLAAPDEKTLAEGYKTQLEKARMGRFKKSYVSDIPFAKAFYDVVPTLRDVLLPGQPGSALLADAENTNAAEGQMRQLLAAQGMDPRSIEDRIAQARTGYRKQYTPSYVEEQGY